MRVMTMKRSIRIAVFGIALWVMVYYLYPMAIIELYGKHIPSKWSQNFAGMNLGEIYQKVGLPQEEASAKDFQEWVDYQWWGVRTLKIITPNCCAPTSKPDEIIYLVYVNGWYNPVYRKTIGKNPASVRR